MAIVNREDKPVQRMEIDLSGPQGNAFFLMGVARKLAQRLEYDRVQIECLTHDMRTGDYEELIQIFD